MSPISDARFEVIYMDPDTPQMAQHLNFSHNLRIPARAHADSRGPLHARRVQTGAARENMQVTIVSERIRN